MLKGSIFPQVTLPKRKFERTKVIADRFKSDVYKHTLTSFEFLFRKPIRRLVNTSLKIKNYFFCFISMKLSLNFPESALI